MHFLPRCGICDEITNLIVKTKGIYCQFKMTFKTFNLNNHQLLAKVAYHKIG